MLKHSRRREDRTDPADTHKGPAHLIRVIDESGKRVLHWTCTHCSWIYALPYHPLPSDEEAATRAVQLFLEHECKPTERERSK